MKTAFVDYRIDLEEETSLNKLNINIIKCPPCSNVHPAITGHPDILLHFLDNKNIIVHKDMDEAFINILKNLNLKIYLSNENLHTNYPNDVLLNAINTKNLFIHNINYTDKTLLKKVSNKKLINVKQGYTKCSTIVLNDKAFITSDEGILKTLSKENLDVLFVSPKDILLPGMNYGFIGGTCGLMDSNTLAFYGSLDYYEEGEKIKAFLKKYDINPIYLRTGKLIDRGSIFTL